MTWRYQSSYPPGSPNTFFWGSNDHTVATNFFLLDIIETKEVLSQHGISTDAMGIQKKSLHRIQVEKMHPKTTWESHKKISWRLSSKTWRTTVLLNKITSFETPLGAWLCHLEVPFLPAGSWGLGGPEKKISLPKPNRRGVGRPPPKVGCCSKGCHHGFQFLIRDLH